MDTAMEQKKRGIAERIMEHPYLFVVALFLLNFVIRGLLYGFTKRIRIYNDELFYYGIAQSLYEGNGLVVRGQAVTFQKILYSLILVPTFAIESSALQMQVIGWVNAFCLSLSVFPAFGIARRLLKKDSHVLLGMLVWFTSSWMVIGATFMSEVLAHPLNLLFVYMVIRAIEMDNARKRILYHALLAIVWYLTYFNKEIALFFLLGYVTLVIYQIITHKGERLRYILSLAMFLAILLIVHLALKNYVFHNMPNTYGYGLTKEEIVQQASRIDWDRIGKTCYFMVYNSLYTILAFGVFPLTIPAILFPKMQRKEKEIMVMFYSSLFFAMGAISFMVSSLENETAYNSRIHTRYVESLVFVSIMLFIHVFEQYQAKIKALKKINVMIHVLYLAIFVAIGYTFKAGSIVDQSTLWIYGKIARKLDTWSMNLIGGNLFSLLFRLLIMIVFAVLLYVLYRSKKFWKIIVASMICLSIANYVAAYASIYKSYHTDREQIPLYEQADEYLSQLDGNILLVLNSDQSIQPYFDSYVKRQLYVDTLRTLVFTDYFEDGVLDLETEKLPQERPYGGISWNLSEVDYIMTFGEVQVENAEQIDGFVLETEGMKLYKNLDSSKVYITCSYLDVLTEDEKKTLIQVNLNDETNVK